LPYQLKGLNELELLKEGDILFILFLLLVLLKKNLVIIKELEVVVRNLNYLI
jgi:hypothetical protein